MNSYGQLSTAFYDLDKPFAPPDAIAFYRGHAARSHGADLGTHVDGLNHAQAGKQVNCR